MVSSLVVIFAVVELLILPFLAQAMMWRELLSFLVCEDKTMTMLCKMVVILSLLALLLGFQSWAQLTGSPETRAGLARDYIPPEQEEPGRNGGEPSYPQRSQTAPPGCGCGSK